MAAPTLTYDGKRIIPVPFVSIRRNRTKTEDGTLIGNLFNITLTGKLVSYRGSPASVVGPDDNAYWDGQWWIGPGEPDNEALGVVNHFENILRKQESLRQLFANDGKLLELTPCNGAPPLKCNPRILDLTFGEGLWVEVCDYQIELECDNIVGFLIEEGENQFDQYLSGASEQWDLEFADEAENAANQHTFRLSHSISARGKRFYNSEGTLVKEAWEWAKEFCQARLGYQAAHSAPDGDGYSGFNYIRAENIDVLGGNYSTSENWVVSKGDALEDFSVSVRNNVQEPVVNVSIEGTIRGLETNSFDVAPGSVTVTRTKFQAASGYWEGIRSNIYSRAAGYAGSLLPRTLNVNPLSTVVGKNPVAGTISYQYEYDTRESNSIPGCLSELITVSDQNPADVIARIFIIGRANGPILQDLATQTEATRTVSIECVRYAATGIPDTAAHATTYLNQRPTDAVAKIMNAFAADLSGSYSTVKRVSDSVNWVPQQGRYSRSITWLYGSC